VRALSLFFALSLSLPLSLARAFSLDFICMDFCANARYWHHRYLQSLLDTPKHCATLWGSKTDKCLREKAKLLTYKRIECTKNYLHRCRETYMWSEMRKGESAYAKISDASAYLMSFDWIFIYINLNVLEDKDANKTVLAVVLASMDIFFMIIFTLELSVNMFSHWFWTFWTDGKGVYL